MTDELLLREQQRINRLQRTLDHVQRSQVALQRQGQCGYVMAYQDRDAGTMLCLRNARHDGHHRNFKDDE